MSGQTSVAVPVFGADGAIVAALSVTAPVTAFEPRRVVAQIRRIAAAASRKIASRELAGDEFGDANCRKGKGINVTHGFS